MRHRSQAQHRRRPRTSTLAALLAIGLVAMAVTASRLPAHPVRPAAAGAPAAEQPSVTSGLGTAAASSPAASPSRAKPTTSPHRSRTTQAAVPVPPPPAPASGATPAASSADCPTLTGPAAAKATVSATLTTAAGRSYWAADPATHVPVNLLKAIAWQATEWQSTMVACDGGIGVMHLSQATAASINQRYGTGYDINTLDGNAALGAGYLTWLIEYFAQRYFDTNPDLTNPDLLATVIAGYQLGAGAVDPAKGIPNQPSVQAVIDLMTTCSCLAW